jgi:hypothetical protein
MNHTHRLCESKRFEPSCDGAIVVAAPSTAIGVDGKIDLNVVGGDLSGEEGEEGVHCVLNGLFKLECKTVQLDLKECRENTSFYIIQFRTSQGI